MTNTDVSTLIESIRSTRDKLEAEIQPQRDAIAATEAEIDRLNAMLKVWEGKAPKSETPKRTARAKSNGKPDDKMLDRVRDAHKALVKATEEQAKKAAENPDENKEPHELALQGFFLKGDYTKEMGVDPTEPLKALMESDGWIAKGAARGMRYGPKA